MLFLFKMELLKNNWLFIYKKKRSRYYKVIKMAIISLLMKYSRFVFLVTSRNVLVMCYNFMKESLWRNANKQNQC